MYRFLGSLFVFLLLSAIAVAQLTIKKAKPGQGSITGNVLDARSGKPLSLASVSLETMSDPVKRYSIATDKNGTFEFQKLSFGYYRMIAQVVGYAKIQMDSVVVRADHSDVDLGDVKLHESSSSLGEVVVYAGKPLIENKEGKITYNVAESPLGNGSNASELLKNMPLVNVNPDGTVLLRGKEPLILMDEKPTNLNAQQLNDLLQSLPANVIEKVEIMVNPPAEYATYAGGVINIVTKKGRVGIYGKLTASAGTKGESSLSSNFSYRSSKLNFNANIGIGSWEGRGNSYSHRQNIYKDSTNYFYTEGAYLNKGKYPNMRFQIDYELNKRQSFGLVYQGNLSFADNTSTSFYTNLDSFKRIYKASSRANQYNGTGYSHGVAAFYQWKGLNPVEKLQVYTGFNAGKNDNNKGFYQQFLQADFLPTGLDSTQSQYFDTYVSSAYIRANYNKPLNDTGTTFFTGGTSFTTSEFHNILNTNFLRKTDNLYVNNPLLSNNFYFDQSIFTMRAGVVVALPLQWRLITNAQAEYTATTFRFIRGNAASTNNGYWRVLPSVTVRKDLSRELNIAWVFRETIRRPGMTELNPSIDYSDPYNVRFGNPYLAPSLTDNFDLNISYAKPKFNINASAGYNKVKNVFNAIRTLLDSGKTQITYQNISDQNEYQFSIWTGITLNRMLRFNLSSGYNYNQYSDREKKLYRYKGPVGTRIAPSRILSASGTSSPAKCPRVASPQGRSHSNVNMSFGVQRKFLNRKLVVGLTAIDPFGLLKYSGYTYGTNFKIESFSSSNSRNFRLTVSYQLSKVMLKNKMSDKEKQDALDRLR
ncbi:MAG: outer membrane beta-barrel family protein [Sediminibacterium sp.]